MNICVFGDSIVWGACDYEKGGWVERLKSYLMQNREGVDVYNLGVSGNNSQDLLKRFESEISARESENTQIVVFAIGINDSQYVGAKNNPRVNLKEFASNILDLIAKAKRVTNNIVFVGLTKVDESKVMPIPWDKSKFYENNVIQKYDLVLRKTCEDNGLPFVDLFEVLDNYDLEDGLHPNFKGHAKIFDKVKPVVEKIIDQL